MTLSARAEALFSSTLQRSDRPTARQIRDAITTSLSVHGGPAGCAAALAAEYGEHPEMASTRMRWALTVAAAV